MPRNKLPRFVETPPAIIDFRPGKEPPGGFDEIVLSIEGYEAIRLCDYEKLDNVASAKRMNVSSTTFGRVLTEARAVVAEALIMGRKLQIKGGNYTTIPLDPCPLCRCRTKCRCRKGGKCK